MDAWLVSLAVIVPLLCLAVAFYLLIIYAHPEDESDAYVPKILVVLGLTLCMGTVMLIPLDVANKGGVLGCGTWNIDACGGLDLVWTWQIVLLAVAVLVLFVIPFAIFYYEAYEPEIVRTSRRWQATEAIWYQIFATAAVVLMIIITYSFLSTVKVPVHTHVASITDFTSCHATEDIRLTCDAATTGRAIVYSPLSYPARESFALERLSISTTFFVFLTTLLGFIGWFVFAPYAGIGLVAVPVDNIRAFLYRPSYIPKDVYVFHRDGIAKRLEELTTLGGTMKRDRASLRGSERKSTAMARYRDRRDQRKVLRQFKKEVAMLEEEFEELELSHVQWKDYNPLVPYFRLVAGVLSIFISTLWVLQIILYMLARSPYPSGAPTSYFLNVMLNWATKKVKFSLFGVFLCTLFSMYLFFAVVKGNFKFGLRFFVVEIHPMRAGRTYMNSFLVNVSLLLLCTPPVVMFCALAFSDFVALTDVDQIFGNQIRYMDFFRFFFDNNVFVIVLLCFSFLTAVYLFMYPLDKDAKSAIRLKENIAKYQRLQHEAQQEEGKRAREEAAARLRERLENDDEEEEEEMRIEHVVDLMAV